MHQIFVRIQVIHWIRFAFIDPELSRQFESGRHPGSHYPVGERWFSLPDQSVYSYRGAGPRVDSVQASIQVPNFLGSGYILFLLGPPRRSDPPRPFVFLPWRLAG